MLNTIYKLTNKINSKIYIGQTWQSLPERWNNGAGYKHSIYLNSSIKKYGKENFSYEVLTFCGTQETADYWEIYFINKYNSRDKSIGYNLKCGGSRGKLPQSSKEKLKIKSTGRKHTEAAKKIMSEKARGNIKGKANKGRPGLKGSENGNHKLTEEQILQIRLSDLSHRKLANLYNVNKSLIGAIKKRKIWRHI